MWLDSNGNIADMHDFASTIRDKNREIYVGTDSHSINNYWIFATVICCHTPGNGGRFFMKRIKVMKNSIKTLAERLLHEAHLSIEAAQEVEEIAGRKPQVHVDVAKKGTVSSKSHTPVTSYVKGMGFEVASKPDAWASSSVADRKAR